MFQKYALFPHLNVFENVAFGLRLQKLDEKEIRSRCLEMLELVGLKGYERRNTAALSGGQQQRVAIARALVNHPKAVSYTHLQADHRADGAFQGCKVRAGMAAHGRGRRR